MLRIVTGTVVLLAGMLGWCSPAAGQAGDLEFVSPDRASVSFDAGASEPVTVWLKNTTGRAVIPTFTLVVQDARGAAVPREELAVVVVDDRDAEMRPVDVGRMAPDTVGRYRLVLRWASDAEERGIDGQLVAGDRSGAGPTSLPVAASPVPAVGDEVTATLVGALLLAALLVFVIAAASLRGIETGLASPLGQMNLDFKTSFASTLTTVGALVGTIISAGVISEDATPISKGEFVALNALFGIAVAVAPVLYSGLQRVSDGQLRGYVGTFLVASIVTVWAAFGELWTLWLISDQLGQGQGFSDVAVSLFKGLLAVAGVAMLLFTTVRIRATVRNELDEPSLERPEGYGGRSAGLYRPVASL